MLDRDVNLLAIDARAQLGGRPLAGVRRETSETQVLKGLGLATVGRAAYRDLYHFISELVEILGNFPRPLEFLCCLPS